MMKQVLCFVLFVMLMFLLPPMIWAGLAIP